jgi:hypothetical protein
MSAPKPRGPDAPLASPGALIASLERTKNRFTPEDRAAKRSALAGLVSQSIREPGLLLRFHEALCFLRAYPDDAVLLAQVEDALAKFGARVAALLATGPPGIAETLDETGVAATTVYCPLSYAAASWLAAAFPDSAELDWDDGDTEERVAGLLPLVVGASDEDALVEVGIPSRAWLAAAKGAASGSDLAWLLGRLARAPLGGRAALALYDARELRVRWELGEGGAARTRAHLPVDRVFFHRGRLRRPRGSLARRRPGHRLRVRPASPAEGAELLDTARAAVIVRYREVHGFNFADPADVLLADAGRGVRIAWFGLRPGHRLPLRAHYGYLLLKNGVPVGYGDASLLFDWVELAYNIFDTFRQGESGFVFARILGFLRQQFGTRTFHLSRYQIGHDNDEALASGAFWFYYKLGFRPTRAELARLARQERRRITLQPGYRSSRATLRRLAGDGMVLEVGGAQPAARAFDVRRVGLAAARLSASGAAGRVARAVGAPGWRSWPSAERLAFRQLAPLLALIPDLPDWPRPDRSALVPLIRAKGGRREADYLGLMRRHRRLRAALLRLADTPRDPAESG